MISNEEMARMANQKVIFQTTASGRAFEKVHRPDGSFVLIADKATHERALRVAGAKLREAIREVTGGDKTGNAGGKYTRSAG
jgi:hypothetical protein